MRSESATSTHAIQDQLPNQPCWGCGPNNPHGLRIKSYWSGDTTVCTWQPEPHYQGWPGVLNGGVVASLVDCHCVCTAISDADRNDGRGDRPVVFATGSLTISYLRPVPIHSPVELTARITERTARKSRIECRVNASGELCARAEVLAIRVTDKLDGLARVTHD
ncbi:MAG: PaaI family thioesterase [Chloroflexi bacterium]|nr:PaaI family thioesterase [Chloroflexota bacterium]MBV9543604.1 PaaI family thioesterase [Chloroflexota bacterium]